MANYFRRIVIRTSIGKMVFECLERSGDTLDFVLRATDTPSLEGSTCACIARYGTNVTTAITGSFEIYGLSGTGYQCRVSGQNIQINLGSVGWQNIFGYYETSSMKYINLPYFTIFHKTGESEPRYGLNILTGQVGPYNYFSQITNSQVTTTTAGYYVATVNPSWSGSVSPGAYTRAGNPTGYAILEDIIKGSKPFDPEPDPFEDGGETSPGGGTGNFDNTGDAINIPSLPTLSAVDTGFITLFNPTITQLNSLATYMWTNPLFDPTNWKRIFANPMDAILGLSIVPVAVPDGGLKTVTVGNISTDVSMTVAASQYVELDCGTLNVNEFWGAYLDYSPYTKAEIYLPYIGTHPLDVDDIMGKAVHVVYHIDILSGACCAYIKCGNAVLYSFVGQCSSSIPITGDDWTNVINGALSIASSIGTMIATGGASAPIVTGIAATAINQMKPSIEKSGSMGGTGGMMGIQKPYLILTRPRQALPANQNEFTGYPSFIAESLDSIHGYTEVEYIHLDNVHATDGELAEIESILKTGVIL